MSEQWRPSAKRENAQLRAAILKQTRDFFDARNVLEVDTPILCHSTATDAFLASFETELSLSKGESRRLFLQTSPEFPMKRLLADGYGSIFQICKAFRNGEMSHKHNPEFTILEWYRVGFTHLELMDEMEEFLAMILRTPGATRTSYAALFEQHFGINPHTCPLTSLQAITQKHDLHFDMNEADRDVWLDLLLTHLIEPALGQTAPLFLFDYPASQAGLAKVRVHGDYQVGERFEVYYKGVELANGYHELGDSEEQQRRFTADNLQRAKLGFPIIPLDQHLLAALPSLPNCAGVALGVDRLVALAVEATELSQVITFTSAHA